MKNKTLLPKPSVNANKPEWARFLSQFMPRKKANEIAIDVRNKLILKAVVESNKKTQKPKNNLEILKTRYPKFSKRNDELAAKARVAAYNANKRVRNWIAPKAKCRKTFLGEYDEVSAGYYKGRFKGYKIWNYQPVYTSYYRIGPNGKKLIYVYGFENPEKRVISAPKGMIFTRDENGLMLQRLTDKMDYHVSVENLLRKDFATYVRKMMAANYSARQNQRKQEKIAALEAAKNKARAEFLEQLFKKDLKTTMVTLNDSRKAGNCVEGTLAFAERKLGISRQEIMSGGHLFSVAADKILKFGESRALAAAKIAWQRETSVCI